MSISGAEPTDPHDEIDHRLRVRRLEQQLSMVAEALRLLAAAADEPEVAVRVEDLLRRACL